MLWVERVTAWYSCSPASALLKQCPGWNSSGYNPTSSKKEKNLHIISKECFVTSLQALYQ